VSQTRRVCISAVADEIAADVVELLYAYGLVVEAVQKCFDRDVTLLRISGPSLPDWCAMPQNYERYAYASIRLPEGDGLQFVPASELPNTALGWPQAALFSNHN
jgi:hypothetical protein